ncbi:MAG: urea transporter [bacterium]|nr:urea transporter [bacterium]
MLQLTKDILTAYGAVLFSGRKRTGVLFFAATMLQPHHGLFGLLGALTAHFLAQAFFVDRSYIKSGIFGAAGLLTGLALSLYLEPTYTLFLLVPLSAAFATIICATLVSWLGWTFGLPVTALPFVLATWLGLLTSRLALGSASVIERTSVESFLPILANVNIWLANNLPGVVKDFLQVIGATSLQTSIPAGILILVGVLLGTRVTAFAMIIGAAVGLVFIRLLTGNQLSPHETALSAFNCVFTAGALGGVFVLPNRNGILFALFGVILVAVLSVATMTHLQVIQLPPLAFPFAIGLLLLLWPIRSGLFRGVYIYPLASVGTAEANLRQYWRWLRRIGQPFTQFRMPHYGSWAITQGIDSQPTHNGIGKFSYDFMLLDEVGKSANYPGLSLTDYYGYGLPVLAPAAGTIAAVLSNVSDNAPQNVNTEIPYGNYVSIYHAPGEYSLLAHLQPNSVKVVVGQPVTAGQEIARVGNSGRSPEPHLHINLQTDWYPGAQSIPAFWSGLLAKRQKDYVYLAKGNPQQGDLVSDFFSTNTIKLEDYFPWHVIGAEWQYQVKRGATHRHESFKSKAGLYGRILLDDNEQVLSAFRTSGHWQLDALDETDSNFIGAGKRGILAMLAPGLTCLPLFYGVKYTWEIDVHGYLLANPLRRVLELPGSGTAKGEGYRFQTAADGSRLLCVTVSVTTAAGHTFRYELTFRQYVGLVEAKMYRGKNCVLDASLLRYDSRLFSWTNPDSANH